MDPEKLIALIESIRPTVRRRAHADRAAVSVDTGGLLALMQVLRDDPALRFDFLLTHTAIDRIDDHCFELVYILYSTVHGHNLFVSTNIDRENPVAPSVCGLWPIAEWQEREVYDLMGVLYDEHPDLRRMFLEDDWVGFPLRKDYQDDHMLELPEMSVRIRTLEEHLHTSPRADSELTTQEYLVNMGPQHPIAHGSLRVVLRLDGENVKLVIPVPGYVHRGVEKMCEHLTYRQIIPYTDRLDYLSAIMNNWAVAKTVEKAIGIETNERIETIRTIMSELQRLQSHALWWGVTGMDLGAYTAFLYGFREREIIGEIFEETIGARLTMNYIQPGGLMYDIKPDFAAKVKKLIPYLHGCIAEYETLLSGNTIFQERLRNIGIMDGAQAVALGCTGPILRASGVAHDLRATEPYGVYDKVDFNVVVGAVGDSWDRYYVRLHEMRESLRIIEQLIDNVPEGEYSTLRYNEELILPEGMHYGQTETARGAFGVFIDSDGKSTHPRRLHFRSPSFNNMWVVTQIAAGWRIADFIAIQSSLDLVIPDIDR